MLAVSLECLDLPSKQQTGHFSSYHFSLYVHGCARVYVCVCVLSPLIRLSQSLCICVCVYVCEVCVLTLGVFVYKVCYSVKLIVFTSHL